MAGDALRTMLLEMNGYRTDIIEFVPSRYTDKNVMLRATRGNAGPADELAEEYKRISEESGIAQRNTSPAQQLNSSISRQGAPRRKRTRG